MKNVSAEARQTKYSERNFRTPVMQASGIPAEPHIVTLVTLISFLYHSTAQVIPTRCTQA
jgi:hypothetical protein